MKRSESLKIPKNRMKLDSEILAYESIETQATSSRGVTENAIQNYLPY